MVSSVITRVRSCSSEVPNPNPGNHVDRFARQRNGVWRLQFLPVESHTSNGYNKVTIKNNTNDHLNSFHSHFTGLLITSKGGFSIIQNKKGKVQLYAQATLNLQQQQSIQFVFGKPHSSAFANLKQQSLACLPKTTRRKKRKCVLTEHWQRQKHFASHCSLRLVWHSCSAS
jgi:hypothetical protein